MSLLNTEFAFSNSGTTGSFLQPLLTFNAIRNSGGIVNIAGPIIVGSVIVSYASGQHTAVSTSGVVLAVNHATSGMFAQLSGQELLRFDGVAHSGLGTANLGVLPGSLTGINFLARSGVVTLNSGTHTHDIIVLYANIQG